MALQSRIDLVEGIKLLDGEVAAQGEHGVQSDRRMAFGENKAIPIRPVRALGIDPQDLEIQNGQDICCRQRPPQVPCLGLVDRLNHETADLARGLPKRAKILVYRDVHESPPSLFRHYSTVSRSSLRSLLRTPIARRSSCRARSQHSRAAS